MHGNGKLDIKCMKQYILKKNVLKKKKVIQTFIYYEGEKIKW